MPFERVPGMYVTIRAREGGERLIDTAQITELGWSDEKALKMGWEPVYIFRDNTQED